MASILPIAIGLALITGAGGYLPQAWDWLKHNAVLRDLLVESWPVTYEVGGSEVGLVYYVGHYLPAAAIGKALGWEAANAAMLAWTTIGIALAISWFVTHVGPVAKPAFIAMFFMVFSGLDAVGRALLGPLLSMPDVVLPSGQLDWWAGVALYPANVTSVMWGPQHALAGWVATGLVLYAARSGYTRWVVAIVPMVAIFSPFVVVGLLPIVGAALVRKARSGSWREQLLSGPALLAGFACLPVLAFFIAATADLPFDVGGGIEMGFIVSNPIFDFGMPRVVASYLLFVVLEFGVLGALIFRGGSLRSEPLMRRLLLASILMLTALPLLRYGQWSDLAMRASGPGLFVLAVCGVRALFCSPRRSPVRLLLIAVFVLGAVTPMTEIARAVTDHHVRGSVVREHFDSGDVDATSGIVELSRTHYRDTPRFLVQYVGSVDTFFYEHVSAVD
ncbi:MAG: hypothetical protein RIE08_06775 [Acidimicrobiales bacterium]